MLGEKPLGIFPHESVACNDAVKGAVSTSGELSLAMFSRLLRTQDSVPSLDEHVTVGRSRDSLTPNGSRDFLGKQSPDRSRDQVTLPVQTRSREDAHRVHNTKIGKQPSLAKKTKKWEDSHGRSSDPTVVGDLRGASLMLRKKHHYCFVRSITNAS